MPRELIGTGSKVSVLRVELSLYEQKAEERLTNTED